jgi:primosomal protein N''
MKKTKMIGLKLDTSTYQKLRTIAGVKSLQNTLRQLINNAYDGAKTETDTFQKLLTALEKFNTIVSNIDKQIITGYLEQIEKSMRAIEQAITQQTNAIVQIKGHDVTGQIELIRLALQGLYTMSDKFKSSIGQHVAEWIRRGER